MFPAQTIRAGNNPHSIGRLRRYIGCVNISSLVDAFSKARFKYFILSMDIPPLVR